MNGGQRFEGGFAVAGGGFLTLVGRGRGDPARDPVALQPTILAHARAVRMLLLPGLLLRHKLLESRHLVLGVERDLIRREGHNFAGVRHDDLGHTAAEIGTVQDALPEARDHVHVAFVSPVILTWLNTKGLVFGAHPREITHITRIETAEAHVVGERSIGNNVVHIHAIVVHPIVVHPIVVHPIVVHPIVVHSIVVHPIVVHSIVAHHRVVNRGVCEVPAVGVNEVGHTTGTTICSSLLVGLVLVGIWFGTFTKLAFYRSISFIVYLGFFFYLPDCFVL
jgi:hypothetical protein